MIERLRRPTPSFLALQLAGWGAFAVAMSLSRVGSFPLDYMVVTKVLLAALGFTVTFALRAMYRELLRREWGLTRALVAAVAASYVASLAWTAVYNLLAGAYTGWYFARPGGVTSTSQLFSGAVYHALALVAWSVLYFGIKYYGELQAERERALRAEALAHRARLQALRYQINPHFLFNTLNAVSTLVAEGRQGEATRMIARLSDFLRLTLHGSDTAEVPLADEVEYARRYLEIERVRFGSRLAVDLDVDVAALGALVPSMILQPLVENAVRYAVAPRESGGAIAVSARADGATLRLRVADDGPGLSGDPAEPGRGVGLANTRERLREIYGADHRFELRRAEGGGLSAEIDLPLVFANGGRAASPAAETAAAMLGVG